MLGNTYATQVCSISRALELVGERWSLLILRNALFADNTRFGEFQRSLGIASNVLSDRLDRFVEAGVMERRDEGGPTYLLTEKGRDFAPALIALTEWGDKWAAPAGAPILYRHAACGAPVHNELRCDHCGVIDDDADIHALPGPGMPEDRAARIRERLERQGVAVS